MNETGPLRGEIWRVDLPEDPKSARPALVVSTDEWARSPLRVIIPFTTLKEKHRRMMPRFWPLYLLEPDDENHLPEPSIVDVYQTRPCHRDLFVGDAPIGTINRTDFEEILNRLARLVGIEAGEPR